MNLSQLSQQYIDQIDQLSIQFIESLRLSTTLKESIMYSYCAGGKRIRPLLLLSTLYAFNDDLSKGLHTSSALEYIHTSSLIHDDLPAMDNDDYRRGKLTNHKVFGEATAILAGDALLVNAFSLICKDESLEPLKRVRLCQELAQCSGANGMIGGQQLDIENENKSLTLKELMNIHEHKTGKLIQFALIGGAIIASQPMEVIEVLKEASFHIGIAFQIKDDILDVTESKEQLGKSCSDEKNHKNTYVSLLGLEKAKLALNEHYNTSLKLIKSLNIKSSILEELFQLIIDRNK